MYKIKNVSKEIRKFLDNHTGKEIFIKPGESIVCKSFPKESSVWEISEFNNLTKKTKLKEDK